MPTIRRNPLACSFGKLEIANLQPVQRHWRFVRREFGPRPSDVIRSDQQDECIRAPQQLKIAIQPHQKALAHAIGQEPVARYPRINDLHPAISAPLATETPVIGSGLVPYRFDKIRRRFCRDYPKVKGWRMEVPPIASGKPVGNANSVRQTLCRLAGHAGVHGSARTAIASVISATASNAAPFTSEFMLTSCSDGFEGDQPG